MTNWTSKLKDELRERALQSATTQSIPHYSSLGDLPTILFPMADHGNRHGNFPPEFWQAVRAATKWSDRLDKVHTQTKRALPVEMQAEARELDSSNSSDGLLMNCFCFPGTAPRIMKGLGLWETTGPTALTRYEISGPLPGLVFPANCLKGAKEFVVKRKRLSVSESDSKEQGTGKPSPTAER